MPGSLREGRVTASGLRFAYLEGGSGPLVVLKIATFWSAALGRPLDKGSSEQFASIGGTDAARREPAWYFNKVPEPKRAKNRVHLDLVNPDLSAVDELIRLGATVIGEHKIPGQRWTVMQDPEGNEFCIAAKSFTGWD